jgi:hypothetical protein
LDGVQKPKATVMVAGLLVVYYSILFGAKFLLENYGNTPFYISILFSLIIVLVLLITKWFFRKSTNTGEK